MTTVLLGALVTCCAGLCVEGYFILGNQLQERTTNEQILASSLNNQRLLEANMRLLAMHPSKSADRTVAPDDAPAFVPYPNLRAMPDPEPTPRPADELDRWADDGGPEPVTEPDPVPVTQPMARVLVEHWAADLETTGPIPRVLDAADEALAAFSFAPGHVR